MWFLSALAVDFLTPPRHWVPGAIPHPILSRVGAGSDPNPFSCGRGLRPGSLRWHLSGSGFTCRCSCKGRQQNSPSFGFNKWNLILTTQKLYQFILGFCSFRWFMGLTFFFFSSFHDEDFWFSKSNLNQNDTSQSCHNRYLVFPSLK